MRKAEDSGLDLVEISPTARPPVCKIMDYGKFKYEQAKRYTEARKHQSVVVVKEIKMRPSTGEHDLIVKINRIRKFLGQGNKAKVTVQFRGREMAYKERGRDLLLRVISEVAAIGTPEQMPKFEGRFLSVVVQPGKAKPEAKAPKVKKPATEKTKDTAAAVKVQEGARNA